jgi:hypothetical protein
MSCRLAQTHRTGDKIPPRYWDSCCSTSRSRDRSVHERPMPSLSEPSATPPPSRGPLHTFTREALHKLVWSESTRTLSKRFDISDVGLAKACRRANIPTPDRGYWARVAAGQGCEKTPLPPLETAAAKIVRFRGRGRSESPSATDRP